MSLTRMRQQQVYRAYALRQAAIARRIASIRNAIAAGIDVRKDPEYAREILLLETELGRHLFVFEDCNMKVLEKEEGKNMP